MLDLKMNINQQSTSHLRFQEQLLLRDPTTGETQKNPQSGEPIMVNFIPRSFQKKNPIVSSKEVSKEQQILTFVKRVLDIHKQYKKDMSKIFK